MDVLLEEGEDCEEGGGAGGIVVCSRSGEEGGEVEV